MVIVSAGKSDCCFDQVLNNKGLKGHGGVIGSVSLLVIEQTDRAVSNVYKITNTRRLGLSLQPSLAVI